MIDGLEFLACIDGLFNCISYAITKKTEDPKIRYCKEYHQPYWIRLSVNSDMTNNMKCTKCNRTWVT